MSSTSQKHRNFVGEPIRGKQVTELAGVGKVLGGRLQDKGYRKADAMLGQYLVLNKNQDRFVGWMKESCGANTKQARDCHTCLKEWSNEYM